MRICFGEFDWPDKRGKRECLQIAFLDAIAEHDQRPLQSLYDCLESYRRLQNLGIQYVQIKQPWLLSGEARSYSDTLQVEIADWATNSNLTAPWCHETALETLAVWSSLVSKPAPWFFQHPGGGGSIPTGPPPPKGLPEYQPYCMIRERYLQSVYDEVTSALTTAARQSPQLKLAKPPKARAFIDSIVSVAAAYCVGVEKVYEGCGWQRSKDSYQSLEEHLAWAVRFQISEHNFETIAARKVSPKAVSKAIREILKVIDLPERSGVKRGRPKGSRTIHRAHNPSG